jgi:predicted transcriptional regulator of viral defense system
MNTKPDYNALYEIAERQAGYFSAGQARTAGFSWERLSENARGGRFIRIQQGIYRLAQFPASRFEDLFIAWLRAGPSATISHESALSVFDLSDILPADVHVTIPRSASRRRSGIKIHTRLLAPEEITWREGLPVTRAERTITDVLQEGIAEEQVRKAIQEAIARGIITPESMLKQAASLGKATLQRIQNMITETASS